MAVGSAGLLEDDNVEAPVRTCTGGQSKFAGSAGAPAAIAALALEPLELNHAGADGIEGSAEQPTSTGISKADAAIALPRRNLDSDTSTPHMPHA
jgi:hypothetical protein